MREYDIASRYRREAELRARVPFLNLRRPLVATPEVVVLLDPQGCFLRLSANHADELLAKFSFRIGQDVHSTIHPDCDDRTCEFVANWSNAWELHRLGAPVEWLHLSATSNTVLKLRLQQVSYACSTIFDNHIENFGACSVLFVQNLTQADLSETTTADDIHVKNASIYEKRRSTDTDPDLVASIDDRLRTVTGRLVNSHNAACRRLAEDLHDGLGQTLCMVRLDVESAAARLGPGQGSDECRTVDRRGPEEEPGPGAGLDLLLHLPAAELARRHRRRGGVLVHLPRLAVDAGGRDVDHAGRPAAQVADEVGHGVQDHGAVRDELRQLSGLVGPHLRAARGQPGQRGGVAAGGQDLPSLGKEHVRHALAGETAAEDDDGRGFHGPDVPQPGGSGQPYVGASQAHYDRGHVQANHPR